MKRIVLCLTLCACGSTPPTSPIHPCPTVAEFYVRTDTFYYARKPAIPPNVDGPPVVAYLMDIYACNGADIGQKRTP